VKVHDGDVVLVRDGYHPAVAGPDYDTYYLNFLAGTSRTMTVTEAPLHREANRSTPAPVHG
jgi:5-deoxy-glucuronate isomerase